MKSLRYHLFTFMAFAALLLSADPVAAQQPTAYVSSDSITVGDRFGLVLVVPRTENQQIARPIFPARQGESVVRFGDLIVFKSLSSGMKTLGPGGDHSIADTLVYEATTFAIDTARVPPLRLRLVASGDTTAVTTNSFEFPVVSLLDDTREDIEDVTAASPFPPAVWPWLALLAAAALGYLGYRYRERLTLSSDEEEDEEPEVIERDPPLEEALARLIELESTNITDESAIKPFFVNLADVIRTYLSRRIEIPALESTTPELLDHLRAWVDEVDHEDDLAVDLRDILETVDLAKFAASKPAEEWCRGALSESRELILKVEETAADAELEAERVRLAEEARAENEIETSDEVEAERTDDPSPGAPVEETDIEDDIETAR